MFEDFVPSAIFDTAVVTQISCPLLSPGDGGYLYTYFSVLCTHYLYAYSLLYVGSAGGSWCYWHD